MSRTYALPATADLGSTISPSDAILILAGLVFVLLLAVFVEIVKRAPWRRWLDRFIDGGLSITCCHRDETEHRVPADDEGNFLLCPYVTAIRIESKR